MASSPLIEIYYNLSELLTSENLNNLAPIFHKPITQHTNVNISGRFSTTDNTEKGEMSYITVMRNATNYAPHDGYGLAWRKQPQFLIDCANNGTEATTEHQEQFYNMFAQTVAEAITEHGSAAALKEPVNGYLRYNVYLVDNDVLQEEVWINYEQYWDQTGGKNQFLQAAKVWIEPNNWYEFHIIIYSAMGTDIWVWPEGAAQGSANITRGQTYPSYVPQAAGEHFGVAVAQTRNNEWYYDDLEIWSDAEKFPMQLFNIYPDPEYFDRTAAFTVNYVGVGYDPVLYAIDGENHSRTRCFIYNYTDGAWEHVGSHLSTIDDDRDTQTLSASFTSLSDYLNEDEMVTIIAHAANSGPAPGYGYDHHQGDYVQYVTEYDWDLGTYVAVTEDFSNDTNHSLRTYYVNISNIDIAGVHRGNSVDIYCHDPDNIKYGVSSAIITGTNVYTSAFSANIGGPIQEIVSVKLHLSQTEFDPGNYIITSVSEGNEFSTNANYKINFYTDEDLDDVQVDIVYKYWINGDNVQAYVVSDDNRYPGVDYLVKTMPPAVVVVNSLEYAGGLSENAMKEKFIEAIHAMEETTLTKSDIIEILQDNGATYVNTDMSVEIRQYSYQYTKTETDLEDTYTIPSDDMGRFYTDKNELVGLTQT